MGKSNKNEVKKIDFEQFKVLYCLKYVAIESKLQKLVFKYGENNYFLLSHLCSEMETKNDKVAEDALIAISDVLLSSMYLVGDAEFVKMLMELLQKYINDKKEVIASNNKNTENKIEEVDK